MSDLAALSLVIAATASLSADMSLGEGKVAVGIVMPAAWDAANLTFQASADGDTAPQIASIQALNATLASTYGSRYIDVLGWLQAHGDNSANDNADIAAGYTPRSLRFDSLHLNDAGYALVAQKVFSALGIS